MFSHKKYFQHQERFGTSRGNSFHTEKIHSWNCGALVLIYVDSYVQITYYKDQKVKVEAEAMA
jgi:hypothetical protein